MTNDALLRDKLRKIEALIAGGATAGEQAAAGVAAERIRRRIDDIGRQEPAVEHRFSLPDPWSRRLFVALCRRYGLNPFRYARMKRQTVVVKAPKSVIEETIWPAFRDAESALVEFLSDITDKVIREEVHGETGEAEEVAEPLKLAK